MAVKRIDTQVTRYELELVEARIQAIRGTIAPLKRRDRLLALNAVLRSEAEAA